jgi:hypothetical protein
MERTIQASQVVELANLPGVSIPTGKLQLSAAICGDVALAADGGRA